MVCVLLKSTLLALLPLLATTRGQDSSIPDAFLNTTSIIEKYNYPWEQHEVTSQDGYITTIDRIPGTKNCRKPGQPVIMMHGFSSASFTWVLQEGESIAFRLADRCYDVWMCNGRGNLYSRKHTTLDPDKLEFWQFSWHEQGVYDMPKIIDYVLKVTGKSNVSYVGHSMGTTIFFVLGSEKQEYMKKIRVAILLAPVANMSNTNHPLIKLLAPFRPALADFSRQFLHDELPASEQKTPANTDLNSTVSIALNLVSTLTLGIGSPAEVNLTRFPAQQRGSGGASVIQGLHFLQLVTDKQFEQRDLGIVENLKKYNSIFPPVYNLRNISCNVTVFYGDGDLISPPKGVESLARATPPNVVFRPVMEHGFGHTDHVTGQNADALVVMPLMDALEGKDIGASKDIVSDVRLSRLLSAPIESEQAQEKRNKKVQMTKKISSKAVQHQRHRSDRHRTLLRDSSA